MIAFYSDQIAAHLGVLVALAIGAFTVFSLYRSSTDFVLGTWSWWGLTVASFAVLLIGIFAYIRSLFYTQCVEVGIKKAGLSSDMKLIEQEVQNEPTASIWLIRRSKHISGPGRWKQLPSVITVMATALYLLVWFVVAVPDVGGQIGLSLFAVAAVAMGGGTLAKGRKKPGSRMLAFFVGLIAIAIVLFYVGSIRLDLGIFLATAIGSLSYVVVSIWDKYVVSTELEILYDPANHDLYDPTLTGLDPKSNQPSEQFRSVRVLVRNRGRKASRGCVGYVELLRRDPGCTMFSFGPKALGWVNIADGKYIPRGGFATLGIVLSFETPKTLDHPRCDKMKGNTILTAWAHTPEMSEMPREYRLQDAFCPGEFPLKLTVYSEDSSPVSRLFNLRVGTSWQDNQLEASESVNA